MLLNWCRIQNYRRLKDVTIEFDADTTLFVGPNNSVKTSAMQLLRSFLHQSKPRFTIYDFSADLWNLFNQIGDGSTAELPTLLLDVWLTAEDTDLHRLARILPNLDWQGSPLGFRLEFAPKDRATLLQNYKEAMQKQRSILMKVKMHSILGLKISMLF